MIEEEAQCIALTKATATIWIKNECEETETEKRSTTKMTPVLLWALHTDFRIKVATQIVRPIIPISDLGHVREDDIHRIDHNREKESGGLCGSHWSVEIGRGLSQGQSRGQGRGLE